MISSCCSRSKSLSLCHPSLCTVVSGIFWDGFGATKIERSRWIPALLFRWCGSTTADGGDDLIHVGKAMIMPLWMIMVTTLTWIDGWYMLIWPMEMDGNGKLGEWWILLLCWHYWWFIKVTPVLYLKNSCWSNLFGAADLRRMWCVCSKAKPLKCDWHRLFCLSMLLGVSRRCGELLVNK